jgi:hypothetical protein
MERTDPMAAVCLDLTSGFRWLHPLKSSGPMYSTYGDGIEYMLPGLYLCPVYGYSLKYEFLSPLELNLGS